MEQREPDWNAIASSPVFQNEIVPWLDLLIATASESGLTATDMAEVKKWHGYHESLIFIRDFPAAEVKKQLAAAELARKQEEDRNARFGRIRSAFGWLHRVPRTGG